MFSPFIDQHLHFIKKLRNALVLYRGFPPSFLAVINRVMKRLHPGTYLGADGVDILQLNSETKDLVAALLNLEGEDCRWGTYEEFVALSNVLLDISASYKGQIVVVENNLFHREYPLLFRGLPAYTMSAFINYLDADDEKQQTPDETSAILAKYFGSMRLARGTYYGSFVDKDEQSSRIKVEPFFKDYELLTMNEIENGNPPGEEDPRYLFPDPTLEFQELKSRLHFNTIPPHHKLDVVVESVVAKDAALLTELSILRSVCRENGILLSLSLKRPGFVRDHRPEFRRILNRYWDPSADFRELTFYEDPDASLRQIQLSQGALIEDMVSQVEAAEAGNSNFHDIFLTAPTGSGKSVLFQIPAVYLAERAKLVTIVVTPLKALMFDQVSALKKRGIDFAAYLNSDLTLIERENVIQQIRDGVVSIVYLSPELLLSADLRSLIGDRKVGLLVIDEAHLVTTWGRDFRVDYWYLGYYIYRLRRYGIGGSFPILAMTATAVYQGSDDMVLETVISLNMQNPKIYLGKVRRDEIVFDIQPFRPVGSYENERAQKTMERIVENVRAKRKTIVYFPWVKQIKDMMAMVNPMYYPRIGTYYGSQDAAEKEELMQKFKSGEVIVMLATKAFGMGIDISDIEEIYHHAPSGNLCDYVQEIGRVARDIAVNGVAKTDFNSKDLKYTRVLYGLSGIRQYQLSFLLKKLWDVYRMNDKQNFLVSPDTFSFIFNIADNLEQKVKSGLLLLEKDLVKKYGYPVLLVRPRSLFSKCYACVPHGIKEDFLRQYGAVATMISDTRKNVRHSGLCTTTDMGDIYEIDLRKIWEDHFSDLSFPELKKKFFDRELFSFAEDVFPRYRFRIELSEDPEKTKAAFKASLSMVESVLTELGGKYFNKNDLLKAVNNYIHSSVLSRRIANVLLNLFTINQAWEERAAGAFPEGFIQKRVSDSEEQYRIISRSYSRIRGRLYIELDSMLGDCGSSRELLRYLGNGDRNTNYSFIVANLLEAFQLGSFEISGGKEPEIFIRINDPYKLRMLVQRGEYNNLILQDIERRHVRSIELMDLFFTGKFKSMDRWDAIEQYFLGREVLTN
jgi:RecQ family ATP-dependent DNA helicase